MARTSTTFTSNPVKHGWVARVADWPHSSFHRFVRLGLSAGMGGPGGYSGMGFGMMARISRKAGYAIGVGGTRTSRRDRPGRLEQVGLRRAAPRKAGEHLAA